MAFTQADLSKIDAAITSNVRKVTFADGRSTEYQNVGEMLAVRKAIVDELAASSPMAKARVRTVVGRVRRYCR